MNQNTKKKTEMSKKCIICGDEVIKEPDYMVFRCKVCGGGPCVLFVPYAEYLPDACPFLGPNTAFDQMRERVVDVMEMIHHRKHVLSSEYSACQNILATIEGHRVQSAKQPKWECVRGDPDIIQLFDADKDVKNQRGFRRDANGRKP